jgi:hypothetical protein
VIKREPLETHRPTRFELTDAERTVLREIQAESFQRSLFEIKADGFVRIKNSLAKFAPQLDKHGIIRLYARLRTASHLAFSARCPILLHKDHPITTVLLRHLHNNSLQHTGGPRTLLAEFQRRFFCVGAPSLAKRVCYACVKCKRLRARPQHQQIAPLPDSRIQPSEGRVAPFENVGLDLAGPYYVKIGRARVKRWILLICCCQYRCIHLETLASCDTDSFLLAMSRFVARRPRPKSVTSDNGGNLTKGASEIQELLVQLDMTKLQKYYPAIKWKFNPPLAPHSGGFFERLVGVMKRALEAVLPAGAVTDEEFNTMTTVVEGLVNNRPLCKLPHCDPREPEALTPNHFLIGSRYTDIAVLPPGQTYPYNRRWFFLQDTLDAFWARFVAEVIPMNHELNSWLRPQNEFHVGDVVLILERNERGIWKLGIIEIRPPN